ncbi:DUF2812 domain-containing protein [Neobittarella massiliensis]|uniref:DUF2812 domain-containing protein n=2 Tax=Oscillospiraceae TaxID=216572 RepID=A0A8J6IN11_9FIRM|nr:DUF2812 domain-containing protein [Neobittarella massiliensis]MBC3515665.1 DUF2812 domain-containing protein [Neobittarella massiliensis]SCJ50023.1 Protein of uncharacterised function (DUF2812) [uncultured Anaerotruncus sp.]
MNSKKVIPSGSFQPGKLPAEGADDEMEMLAYYAAQGWHLRGFGDRGFVLEQGQPLNCVYCYDVARPRAADMSDYVSGFARSGWAYVASCGEGCHFFRAAAGTPPRPNESQPQPAVGAVIDRAAYKKSGLRTLVLAVLALLLSFVFQYFRWTALRFGALALGILLLFMGGTYFITLYAAKKGDRQPPK